MTSQWSTFSYEVEKDKGLVSLHGAHFLTPVECLRRHSQDSDFVKQKPRINFVYGVPPFVVGSTPWSSCEILNRFPHPGIWLAYTSTPAGLNSEVSKRIPRGTSHSHGLGDIIRGFISVVGCAKAMRMA